MKKSNSKATSITDIRALFSSVTSKRNLKTKTQRLHYKQMSVSDSSSDDVTDDDKLHSEKKSKRSKGKTLVLHGSNRQGTWPLERTWKDSHPYKHLYVFASQDAPISIFSSDGIVRSDFRAERNLERTDNPEADRFCWFALLNVCKFPELEDPVTPIDSLDEFMERRKNTKRTGISIDHLRKRMDPDNKYHLEFTPCVESNPKKFIQNAFPKRRPYKDDSVLVRLDPRLGGTWRYSYGKDRYNDSNGTWKDFTEHPASFYSHTVKDIEIDRQKRHEQFKELLSRMGAELRRKKEATKKSPSDAGRPSLKRKESSNELSAHRNKRHKIIR